MIIDKKAILKELRAYLRTKYPDNFVNSSRNQLFDFTAYTIDKDIFYKLILENEYKKLDDIKNFVRNSTYRDTFINRDYYFVLYDHKSKRFNFDKL